MLTLEVRLQIYRLTATLPLIAFVALAQPPDAQLGQRLFESQCALCHGQNGGGGRGPALTRPKLEKAPTDEALAMVIARGIPPEMPGAWQLRGREINSVVLYVRSLGTLPPVVLPGDSVRGAGLYKSKACAACHIINGAGIGFGPDLSVIGARRSAEHLRQSLTYPDAFIPEEYFAAEATTAAGKTTTGIRANEDTFSIQIKTADGRFHSFRKADLKQANLLKGKSLMPSYKDQLKPAELDDLVAYLASLKARQ